MRATARVVGGVGVLFWQQGCWQRRRRRRRTEEGGRTSGGRLQELGMRRDRAAWVAQLCCSSIDVYHCGFIIALICSAEAQQISRRF